MKLFQNSYGYMFAGVTTDNTLNRNLFNIQVIWHSSGLERSHTPYRSFANRDSEIHFKDCL